jgi:hypothetical protein
MSLYSQQLINEFISFGNKPNYSRIIRIHNKCMKNGHPYIAQKIVEKYPEAFKCRDDRVMAFGYALMPKT